MALLLRLLLLCLWPLGPLSASEILLVGAEDQPGIRSFIAALEAADRKITCSFRSPPTCHAQASSKPTNA